MIKNILLGLLTAYSLFVSVYHVVMMNRWETSLRGWQHAVETRDAQLAAARTTPTPIPTPPPTPTHAPDVASADPIQISPTPAPRRADLTDLLKAYDRLFAMIQSGVNSIQYSTQMQEITYQMNALKTSGTTLEKPTGKAIDQLNWCLRTANVIWQAQASNDQITCAGYIKGIPKIYADFTPKGQYLCIYYEDALTFLWQKAAGWRAQIRE